MPESSDGATTLSATIVVSRDANAVDASVQAYEVLREKATAERYALVGSAYDLAIAEDRSDFFERNRLRLTATAKVMRLERVMGGADGPPGPFSPADRTTPHVYAREVHSGAGNCRCGAGLGDDVHTEAAAGVPIPKEMRRA